MPREEPGISRHKLIRRNRQKQEVELGVYRLPCHFEGPDGCRRFGHAGTLRTSICWITSPKMTRQTQKCARSGRSCCTTTYAVSVSSCYFLYIRTGMVECVRTLAATLPMIKAPTPPRPCEAMMMRSAPISFAFLMISRYTSCALV